MPTEAELQRQKEMQQAEELLFAGPQALGFVKGLFAGHFVSDWVMPYPQIPEAQQNQVDQTLKELREFLDAKLDAAAVDRNADIPREVIDGLGRVGVLGMTAPAEYGGHGFSQLANYEGFGRVGHPVRVDVGFCECPPFDWHSRLVVVWHTGTATEMAAQTLHW